MHNFIFIILSDFIRALFYKILLGFCYNFHSWKEQQRSVKQYFVIFIHNKYCVEFLVIDRSGWLRSSWDDQVESIRPAFDWVGFGQVYLSRSDSNWNGLGVLVSCQVESVIINNYFLISCARVRNVLRLCNQLCAELCTK